MIANPRLSGIHDNWPMLFSKVDSRKFAGIKIQPILAIAIRFNADISQRLRQCFHSAAEGGKLRLGAPGHTDLTSSLHLFYGHDISHASTPFLLPKASFIDSHYASEPISVPSKKHRHILSVPHLAVM